jgi:Na+-transporting methylmalonyl-CoA/oxaloacetate decarboxylase gamma subunit
MSALNGGIVRMLLTIAIIPLVLGLVIVIMAAVKKLKPQPVTESVESASAQEQPDADIPAGAEEKKVSLKICKGK